MRKRYSYWFLFSVFFLITDQLSKVYIREYIRIGDSVKLLGDILRFTHVENTNAIFGLNLPIKYIFFPAAIISLGYIVYFIYRLDKFDFYIIFAMSLITGGAFGNIIDRFFYNSVTDFIDMGIGNFRWYIYNLADAYILIGIILIFIYDFKKKKTE